MKFRLLKHFIILTIAIAGGYFLYDKVLRSDIKEVFSILFNISTAILAIAGIWMSSIFPNVIKYLKDPKQFSLIKGTQDTKNLEQLVLILMSSAFTLISILIYNVFLTLFINIDIIVENLHLLKGIVVGVVIYLSSVQGLAMIKVILIGIGIVNALHDSRIEHAANEDL